VDRSGGTRVAPTSAPANPSAPVRPTPQ
jgi:hypothetical protein